MGNRKGAAHDQEAHRNHYPRTGTNLPLEGVKRALCLGRNFAAGGQHHSPSKLIRT